MNTIVGKQQKKTSNLHVVHEMIKFRLGIIARELSRTYKFTFCGFAFCYINCIYVHVIPIPCLCLISYLINKTIKSLY